MSALPVRLFHAILTGFVIGTILSIASLQLFQHTAAQDTGGGSGSGSQPVVPPSLNPTPDDLDGDGMPNAWEIANSHDPDKPDDASSDFDHDGLTAAEEHLAGTNPLGAWAVDQHVITNLPANISYSNGIAFRIIDVNTAGVAVLRIPIEDPATQTVRMTSWTFDASAGLSQIAPDAVDQDVEVFDINDSGVAVGRMISKLDGTIKGFIWQNGGAADLMTPDWFTTAVAKHINNRGNWVGFELSPYGGWSPVAVIDGMVWRNQDDPYLGTSTNALFDGLSVAEMIGINENDQVLAAYVDYWNWTMSLAVAWKGHVEAAGFPAPYLDPPSPWMYHEALINQWGEFAAARMTTGYQDQRCYYFDGESREFDGNEIHGLSDDGMAVSAWAGWSSQQGVFVWADGVQVGLESPVLLGGSCHSAAISSSGIVATADGYEPWISFARLAQDADGDGMSDDWEDYHGLDKGIASDATADPDGDGINNYGEFLLHTDPNLAPVYDANGQEIDLRPGIDADGDGIPNIWEWENSLDYLDPADAGLDFDRDGYTNLQEFHLKTDPRGAPSYRIREIGPFPSTSSVAFSSAFLTEGVVSGGGNVTESVVFDATPSTGTSTQKAKRPGTWKVTSTVSAASFAPYLPHGTSAATTLLACAENGAALSCSGSSGSTRYYYWPGPDPAAATTFLGSSINTMDLRSPSMSPSGLFVAGMRQNSSNTWQPVLWNVAAGGAPAVRSLAGTNATVTSYTRILVNDAGYAAATAKVGSSDLAVLWRPDGSCVPLQNLSGGSAPSVVGILNTTPPIVVGNCRGSAGKYHAVKWAVDGTMVDMGLASYSPPLILLAPSGRLAALADVVVGNELKQQPTILTPRLDGSSLSWNPSAQGPPITSGLVSLKSISHAGELIGTVRPTPSGTPVPTLWRHGLSYPLDHVVPPSTGFSITSVDKVNGTGALLVTAWKNGGPCKLLLTPDCDTDGDGMPDAYENQHAFNAFAAHAQNLDSDADGLSDLDEYRNGTNPRNADTDADGMKDGWEISWGLLPLDPSDASLDPDNDRVTNLREFQIGTNPTGIYRVEVLPSGNLPYFHAAGDNGEVVRCSYPWVPDAQYELVSSPDGQGARTIHQLIGGSYNYWVDELTGSWTEEMWTPTYRILGNGTLNSLVYDYAGGYDAEFDASWENWNGWWLNPDVLADSWNFIWASDSVDGVLADLGRSAYYLPPCPEIESTGGGARAFMAVPEFDVLLDPAGQWIGNLYWNHGWQRLNDNGVAVAADSRRVEASGQTPVHYEVDVWRSDRTEKIALPVDLLDGGGTEVVAFSDDGIVLLRRSTKDAYGNFQYRTELVNTNTGVSSQVRMPGLGAESIVSLSNKNGRLLGSGPKPFQTTPDGTCIRLEALRIKNGPTANAAPFGTLYPRQLTLNHIASDGRITVTTTNDVGQTAILQIVPQNDSDNDGIPDDWETANNVADGSGDQDGDGLNDAGEFANGGDPFLKDTDGDGMSDGMEIVSGFDITNRDENQNGQSDGYEDFDEDRYINREEVLCGTNARNANNRPDGTSAHADPDGSGPKTPILLVRDQSFELNSIRDATFWKPGTSGFMPGSVDTDSEVTPIEDQQNNEICKEVKIRPKFYLTKKTDETRHESYSWTLTAEALSDPINETTASADKIDGTRTSDNLTKKVDGVYVEYESVFGNWTWFSSFTSRCNGPEETDSSTDTYDFSHPQENSWPNLRGGYQPSGYDPSDGLREVIQSNTSMTTEHSANWDIVDEDANTTGSIANITTVSLSNEYTDGRLIGDLVGKLSQATWWTPAYLQSDYLSATFLWDCPWTLQLPLDHVSASMRDINYHLETAGEGVIEPGTRVVFVWKEVFVPQEGEDGEISAEWLTSDGTKITNGPNSGQYVSEDRATPHPEKPGRIFPDLNRSGIAAPAELAALNPGEAPFIAVPQTDADGNTKTDVTIQRAKPITFQVDLDDQKNNPTLSATPSDAVALWERKKDGTWKNHPLPFKIPAEQSAGNSSDPGKYLLQGSAPGTVTLQISANNSTRATATVQIRHIDLDVDSDNTGEVNQSNDEEKSEADVREPGKILIDSASAESDENGIPLHPDKLAGLKLQTANFQSSDEITFSYPDKVLRIWRTQPGQSPAESDLLIPYHVYTSSELGLSPGSTVEFSIQSLGSTSGLITIGAACGEVRDEVLVNLIPVEVAVDADRNGQIEFGKDKTTAERPFRFWINDDDDPKNSDLDVEEAMKQDENSPPYLLDWLTPIDTHEIEGVRDLEDFTRLRINLTSEIINKAKNGEVRIGFKWTSGSGPRIRMYKAASDSGDNTYEFYKYEASQQCNPEHRKMVIDVKNDQTSYLPNSYWQGVSSGVSDLHFLFEGCAKGTAKLDVVLKFGSSEEVVSPGPWMKLMNVQEMFERGKVKEPMSEPDDVPDPWVTTEPLIFHATPDPNKNTFQRDPDETKQCIIHVHGWRMSYDEAQTWANTSFKRFWHLGYKGRYAFFSWPTYSPATSAVGGYLTYNKSEYRAWLSGVALKEFVATLPSGYTKNIMAHSMGNVVVGSAFRKGMEGVSNYALLNAAMAAQSYDPTRVDFPTRQTPDTDSDSTVQTRFGLSSKFSNITANVTNFYLKDDLATTIWGLNHAANKPQIVLNELGGVLPIDRAYGYSNSGWDVDGVLNKLVQLDPIIETVPLRGVTMPEEAMAFVSQTRSLPAGRTPTDLGFGGSKIDLDTFVFENNYRSLFGSEHSAEWIWSFQRTFGVWRALLKSFDIIPNPVP